MPTTLLDRKLLEKHPPSEVEIDPLSEDREEDAERRKVLVCRECGIHIADDAWRISVDGAHLHTYANPHGLVYDIGCFESAVGCVGVGPASSEFAWFRGYSWQVVICAGCMAHLGWFFQSSGGHFFYGLILDRLVSAY
jgi:ribosomal protein L40E